MTFNNESTVEYPRRQTHEPSSGFSLCLQSRSGLDIHSFSPKSDGFNERYIPLKKVDIDFIELKYRNKDETQQQVGNKENAYVKDQKHTSRLVQTRQERKSRFVSPRALAAHKDNEKDDLYFQCYHHLAEEEEDGDETIRLPFDDFLFDTNSIDY